MSTPAGLLLIWSGLGAALAAGAVGVAIGGWPRAPWSLALLPRSRFRGAIASILAGMVLYPLVYGVTFEALRRADLSTGLLLGALHGLIVFIIVRRRDSLHAAFRAAAVHIAYGTALGFLYVTP